MTAEKIKQAVLKAPSYDPKDIKIIQCGSLDEGVKLAYMEAERGDVVMLSPACASFDQFVNFEQRGNRFKEAVLALQE
ncbi:UDP-N-acetylmuramoylalanine--D-glutamate ligase [bioreactor metagenome]|uniref:UDP-N-acetylmuramoylalanine--D-glutamate ligase n=1 Tax=bioreactor metagenome TaxID=1076179 RepID=A0A645GVV6_9ZZZZ